MAFKTYRPANLTIKHSGKVLNRAVAKVRAAMKSLGRGDRPTAVSTAPSVAGGDASPAVPSFLGGHKLQVSVLADQTAPGSAFEQTRNDSIWSADGTYYSETDWAIVSQLAVLTRVPANRPVVCTSSDDADSISFLDLDACDPSTPLLSAADVDRLADDMASIISLDLNAPAPEAWWTPRCDSRTASSSVSDPV